MATTQTPFPTSSNSPSSSTSSTGSTPGSSSAGSSVGGSNSLSSSPSSTGATSTAASLGGGSTSGVGSSGSGGSSSSMGNSDNMGRNDRMERVVQSAHEAVDTLAAKAAPLVDRFSSGIDGASGQMHDRADQLSAMQEEWVESARTTVREHPLASLAAAVAVGMLLSRLSR